MLRIAIIGCGKIADQHVDAIRRIPETTIVAACDREPLMAGQLAERFGIAGSFGDAAEMLHAMKPDVVHITTPPQSHHAVGRLCLEAGSHVYLEKPFTVTAAEAQSLVDVAAQRNLRITAGHNYQFTPEMLRMRRLVGQGFLGGPPVHLESYWSYDLGDLNYVGPLLGNPKHWVRQLPGQLLHNIISHGISRLVEFLDDEIAEITISAHQSPHLRVLDDPGVIDELRALIRDRRGTTALFCFSTQMKPGLNKLEVYGPTNSLAVDVMSGSLILNRGGSHKSYLTFVVPPLINAKQHLGNAWRNFFDIVRWRLHYDSGMKELIDQFYRNIAGNGQPPISSRDIVLTARIMDEIFAKISASVGGRQTIGA